ncbi:MAG: T9SS type A sorting domain-containing protein [Candidatus Cloacimonadaceae bacterium]|jgi:hypothetical protein|nr:T9SS type A sorting domain-containing protein [Candidatus Cloacimonadota bacterium]MDY0126722.1 T9SS type A sorting domain-containing protein [Candidatus Cloacimonadaceae bacterium]MCB5255498.1 T9SS type A sorting domain-containing protein [Candidatus Cloacimonadota bacterium]MCK9178059.1 T9SS type A sorting domain-containing protein [Candidatus Cloacimonadota bacterium]MCK9242004.1 T9SS type A sorting domain-containing protein [Candidatus Cloacimonadota bacterium]
MRLILLATLLLFLCAGSLPAFTGYEISDTFSITPTTLPVELSSFTATVTGQNFVQLIWVTQSEANLLGFHIYRAADEELASSILISDLISPTNSSSQSHYDYLDTEIAQSGRYYYWLESQEMDGSGTFHGPIFANVEMDADDEPELPAIPLQTRLRQIFPNPFNPSTTISYQMAAPGQVELNIYNARGQKVQGYHRQHAAPGYYHLQFEGRDLSGKILSSGVYHVVMICGKELSTEKIVLLK